MRFLGLKSPSLAALSEKLTWGKRGENWVETA
jgi:hypothetical protein